MSVRHGDTPSVDHVGHDGFLLALGVLLDWEEPVCVITRKGVTQGFVPDVVVCLGRIPDSGESLCSWAVMQMAMYLVASL